MFTLKQYFFSLLLLLGVTVTALGVTRIVNQNRIEQHQDRGPAKDEEITIDADPWNEMQRIISAYYQPNGMSYKGLIKVIDDNGEEEKIVEETGFEYMLYKDEYYYLLGGIEMVKKKALILFVDHAGKSIRLTSHLPGVSQRTPFDLEKFRRWLEKDSASVKVSKLENERILTVDNIADPSMQGYRIYYSPDTYRISKILLGMQRLSPLDPSEDLNDISAEEPDESAHEIKTYTYYLEMNFSEIRALNLKDGDFRPEEKFVAYDKHRTKLTPAFSKYVLINAEEQ